MTKKLTVWFDSDCPLCRREIAPMKRLDRRGAIRFVDAFDPATVCPLDRAEMLSRRGSRKAPFRSGGVRGTVACNPAVASACLDRRLAAGHPAVRRCISRLPPHPASFAEVFQMKDRFRPDRQSRISRLAALGQLAGGVATGVVGEGLRRLAKGERPHLSDLLLTPSNALKVTDKFSRLRGAAGVQKQSKFERRNRPHR